DVLEVGDLAHQRVGLGVARPGLLEVGADAAPQGAGLADIDHLRLGVAIEVDARSIGQALKLVVDGLRAHGLSIVATAPARIEAWGPGLDPGGSDSSALPSTGACLADLLTPERADAVAELGGLLEVEPPRRVLHLRLQLGDTALEIGGRLERLLRRGLHLDGVVVALVDRPQEVADGRADRLRPGARPPVRLRL